MHNETLISDFADFSVLGEFPNKICIKIILCHFNLLWPVFNLPVSCVSCHKKLGLNWYLSTILIFSFYYKVTKTVSIMQILKPVLFIKLLCYKGKILKVKFLFLEIEWIAYIIYKCCFCVYKAKSINFDNCSSAYRQIFRSHWYFSSFS